ncbi:YwdI family protein [Bacillus sp. DTU_2020_1000418_1_SI_GHA_SEK_038]|uniref:YwdI family protein n=1 Tax=Bacillus sp. DTU_2020_1000418_1_SI_GHA_SEK_038 TaxID=3077585 RepID=UPI0028EC6A5E|nr:YwdI family protein [Bacillus sp. DTU_2020_1000418_1_SI_GHA_SEK_038]WNS75329.1 YwdI family protein [Bacillus sp. DTU_2020_1000418_1_SI_GHA_SEK_038]
MNISVQQLLGKMEKELKEAKDSSTTARLRERIHAIKSLCELILDEPAQEKGLTPSINSYMAPAVQDVQPAAPIQQPKRMEMDDSANGESLFDF